MFRRTDRIGETISIDAWGGAVVPLAYPPFGRFGFGAFFFVSSFYHTYISLSIWQYAKIFSVNFVKNHESKRETALYGQD